MIPAAPEPAKKSQPNDSKRTSWTKAPKQASTSGSQKKAGQQTAGAGKKRKAEVQPEEVATTSTRKRARSSKSDNTTAAIPPAPRKKGTSCADCRKRRIRCTHDLPAAETSTAHSKAKASTEVGSGALGRDAAALTRSPKPAPRRAATVAAAEDELPDAEDEAPHPEGSHEPDMSGVSMATPSTSQHSEPNSSPASHDPTSTTPPSSVSAIEVDVTAQTPPSKQAALDIDNAHVSPSPASSVLSSVPSDVMDLSSPDELRRDSKTNEKDSGGEIVADQEAVATDIADKDQATSLTDKEKRAESARKGWLKRKQNTAQATAIESEDLDQVRPLTAKEKKSASARKSWVKRKQNAAKIAEATSKKPTKRKTPARKASSSKQTKLVTLMLPKPTSSGTSKPRSTLQRPDPITPQPKASQQENGLPTPENSQAKAHVEEATSADPLLRQLAEKLTEREPLASKPLPQGQPLVWADSRQALCETVPYFKMPQSGCHQNDRHVYAFLFDSIGHCREYMDSDVIIARAGGGMEADASGQIVQKKHHLMTEAQVQAVLNDIELQNPLVLICGDRSVGAVCKMPHKYNVLGWFKPVSVWAEKTLGKGGKKWTTIKYRFERLNDSKPAWHQPEEQMVTDEDRQLAGDLTHTPCPECHRTFAHTYLCGWMCLNPDCDQFWKLEDGGDAPYGKLLYNPAFLLDRTRWAKEEEPYSVRPAVPTVGNTVGDNLTYINTRGICCPECGRCSSRRLFKGWRCDNPSCTFENFPQHIPVTPPMLHNPWENSGDGPALARNKHEGSHGVNVVVTHVHGFKVFTYTIAGVNGKFVHAVSNAKINREPRGPDEMFAAIQGQDEPGMDMHLERRRFGIEKMPVNKIESQTVPPVPAMPAAPSTPLRQSTLRFDLELDTLSLQRSSSSPVSPEKIGGQIGRERSSRLAERCQKAVSPNLADSASSTNAMEPAHVTPTNDESQSTPDVAAEMTENDNGSFLAGIEEAAEADEPQKSDPKDTTTVGKPVVEDGDLMTAFSINYGMPYKFVAVGSSLPFTDSPWPVRTCRADLNWASQTFLDSQDHMDFNEELIFAYLEGQKIEYHDDGESGLGPRIATLSLGGKAKMHLRMKMKHYTGCSKTGIFTAEKPMPHSIDGPEMYQKRLAAWNELQTLKATDKPAYERRRKELPKELGLFSKRMKKAEDLVTVTLNHGDIVLMEGYEIQQYLEHKVVPEQCLRFALTCRTVLPDHLKPEERPAYEVELDDGSMSCLRGMVARDTEA